MPENRTMTLACCAIREKTFPKCELPHTSRSIPQRCWLRADGSGRSSGEWRLTELLLTCRPPNTKRWTARRKASVVAAVQSGIITIEGVCQRYGLPVDEFLSWHNAMQRHGLQGLRTTKLQNYRYSRPKKD